MSKDESFYGPVSVSSATFTECRTYTGVGLVHGTVQVNVRSTVIVKSKTVGEAHEVVTKASQGNPGTVRRPPASEITVEGAFF